MSGTVFISYSVKDNRICKEIMDTLEAYSLNAWRAPEKIPTGSSYAREIPKAIKECSVFVMIVSRNSQESIWVEKEVDMAVNERKYIVPINVDGSKLSDVYKFYLNNVQMINYNTDKSAAKTVIINNIKKCISLTQNQPEPHEVILGTKMKPLFEDDDEPNFSGGVVAKDESAADMRRKNIMTDNKAPECCEYCAGRVVDEGYGVYRCTVCGKESYDYFRKIRNYLDKVGSAPATTISIATGVPRRIINAFFREEKLEIPYNSEFRVKCKSCGKPIRTGELCESCKNGGIHGSVIKDTNRGKWHSNNF